MKIGELAKKGGCLVETIRYYEQEGLLAAALRDPINNYRHYDHTHLEQLTFIRHCRALDMTHEEIRTLLAARAQPNASCESINELINEHLQHVKIKITELQQLEKQLSTLQSSCQVAKTTQDCGILHQLEQLEPNSILNKPRLTSHVVGQRYGLKKVAMAD